MTSEDDIMVRAALEWLAEHTTLKIESYDASVLLFLPASAQLFCRKFAEVMRCHAGVASQSIEGLSMSFDTGADANVAIWNLARALLGGCLKPQARVLPAQRRW